MSEQEGATLIEHYDTDMDEEVKWYQPIGTFSLSTALVDDFF